ncbi:MAG: diguanylate cyclase [Planctomycetota bacterium]
MSKAKPSYQRASKTNAIPVVDESAPLVLVVEDDRASAIIVRKRLECDGIRVLMAVDGAIGLKLAREHKPDLIVTDWCMPKLDGPSLCEALRRDPAMATTYIIILSSRSEPAERVEGLRRGADDYLGKDKNHEELVARVQAGLRIRALQKQLTAQARTDVLTGLINRGHFRERLVDEIERSRRYGELMSLAMIDLDRFKEINDTAGHPAGDAALCFATRLFQQECRGTDLICRYGGDEFAILFMNADSERASSILERIRAELAENPFEFEDSRYPFGLSYGLSEINPDLSIDPDEIIRLADEALYVMKRKGGSPIPSKP